jgi:hypothetical protein
MKKAKEFTGKEALLYYDKKSIGFKFHSYYEHLIAVS